MSSSSRPQVPETSPCSRRASSSTGSPAGTSSSGARHPADVIGRVSSALQLINIGPVALAPLLATTGLERLGATGALAVTAATAAAGVVVVGTAPRLRRLGVPTEW